MFRLLMAAAGAGAYLVYQEIQKEERKRTCSLCKAPLHTGVYLQCEHNFHTDCLNVYVSSLKKCTKKCPECSQKISFNDLTRLGSERRSDKVYCHICSKIVRRITTQALPCKHEFCKECLVDYNQATELGFGSSKMCPLEECPDYHRLDVASLLR